MDDELKLCKSNLTKKTHVYEYFKRKGSGIEDGCYKHGPVCFIKEKGAKIHLPDNSYVVHLDNGRAVYSEEEFNEVFKVVKNKEKPVLLEPERVIEVEVKDEPKTSEPEKTPEIKQKPEKKKKKKKK